MTVSSLSAITTPFHSALAMNPVCARVVTESPPSPKCSPSMQVEIWSDVICPWCYLGKRRFEQAVTGLGEHEPIDVIHRSFELNPAAPVGTTTPMIERLTSVYGMSPDEIAASHRQME